jgi:transcriptional regulator with XRE-family HTH domain
VAVTTFARALARARRAAGISQAALSERSGVRLDNIRAYERGLGMPRVDRAVALARALGVAVERLVAGEEAGPAGGRRKGAGDERNAK